MRKNNLSNLVVPFFLLLSSCNYYDGPEFPVSDVWGYRPVYENSEFTNVVKLPPEEIEKPGKIYVYDHYLLINDVGKGVHFIDNTNPRKPRKCFFLRILGNHELSVRNNILYADYLGFIAAIDISDTTNISLLNTLDINDQSGEVSQTVPPGKGYFECPDPSKGKIIAWYQDYLENPDCAVGLYQYDYYR